MRHIVLLGDSVFDNRAYTRGAPDVAEHLRDVMPQPSTVTLCAIDGTTTYDFARQLQRVPEAATDLILSLGGNNAIMNADLLDTPVRSTGEALDLFRDRVDAFGSSYNSAVESVLALARPTVVCTIYHGNLGAAEALRAPTAIALFNDVILRAALRFGLSAIDLRAVCELPEDFANPIEPSGTGGKKIALAIARSLRGSAGPGRSIVTGG